MKVGFIGLGNMGSGMARNLIQAGHKLIVYNRTRSRAEPFQSLGAIIAGTIAEAASQALRAFVCWSFGSAISRIGYGIPSVRFTSASRNTRAPRSTSSD